MAYFDKHDSLPRIEHADKVLLDLGCGRHKRNPQAVGIDIADHECVDIVGDIAEVLELVPPNKVAGIYSYHCLEHMADLRGTLSQIARVLIPGGICEITVPHFSNPYYYSDPTHKTPFGLYTMSYFVRTDIFQRRVPAYWDGMPLELKQVSLEFKSERPFYARYSIKRLITFIVNSCGYLKEFYEENLTFILPCYEIKYVLQKAE
jgi:SAM-dependent methyltransferase